MESRLPSMFFGSKNTSSSLYLEFVADFNDNDYQQKRSDLLGKHVLKKIREMGGNPDATDAGQSKKSMGGHIFELLVAEMLVMHKITPFYTQVEMWKVPMSKFDFLLFHDTKPVVLTCKLSIAERWRQASIEGILLKNIYRQGKCYLISGDERSVNKRNHDIDESKIDGIDKFYTVGSDELETLLNHLSNDCTFSTPLKIDPIVKSSKKVCL